MISACLAYIDRITFKTVMFEDKDLLFISTFLRYPTCPPILYLVFLVIMYKGKHASSYNPEGDCKLVQFQSI